MPEDVEYLPIAHTYSCECVKTRGKLLIRQPLLRYN